MTGPAAELRIYGSAVAVLVYLGFCVYLTGSGALRREQGSASRIFVAAVASTAMWALLSLVDIYSRYTAPGVAASAFDVLRYALWFAFLLAVLRPALAASASREAGYLLATTRISVVVAFAAVAALGMHITSGGDETEAPRWTIATLLALPLIGLVLVEQLFRNLPDDSRWGAKPLCLALAVVFGFDLYLYAEAVLFGGFDDDARSVRAAVHALALPLLFVASRRRADWIGRLQVSRSAAFYSTTLLLVGAYLLFMSAVGYYVRYFGGDWGRALQLALLAAALVALTTLVLSGSLRSRLRVFVGKHFFSYRYDYREEWLRFTAMLSSTASPQEVAELVVRGLANMVECPAGSLWRRIGDDSGHYTQAARWNQPASAQREPAGSPFCLFLQTKGWVVDLDEYRNAPRRYGDLVLPHWLLADAGCWLVVPLSAGDDLLGFVTLARPRTAMELNWEVRDLLKTASRQAASFLAQMHATEALLEARKFEAFNRMSAFVVHDLKNIVTQLSLMMKNAQRLHANPEFQQDMLLTVDSSLEKMRRLMLQLREGATPPGGSRGVELAPILRRLADMAAGRGRMISVECSEGLATRGHEERLERVLGHLVHNALDATPAQGRVWVQATRFSGQVRVEVGDTGSGMSEDFVQNQLFRPFSSTKPSGMGIGSYESAQYIRELGGSIAVASELGRGTVVTLDIPLFDAHIGSDLEVSARS